MFIYPRILLERFISPWTLLEMFINPWNLLEMFIYPWTLLEMFIYPWTLLEMFIYPWTLLCMLKRSYDISDVKAYSDPRPLCLVYPIVGLNLGIVEYIEGLFRDSIPPSVFFNTHYWTQVSLIFIPSSSNHVNLHKWQKKL